MIYTKLKVKYKIINTGNASRKIIIFIQLFIAPKIIKFIFLKYFYQEGNLKTKCN